MTKFVYKFTKNTSTKHTSFQQNCRYHFYILFKKDISLYFRFKSVNKLIKKPKNLIFVY